MSRPRATKRLLRLAAAACMATGLTVAFLPGTSGAATATQVGWWYHDVPASGQAASRPVVADIRTSAADSSQVPPTTLPPLPVPTVPPPVTVPDPGTNIPSPIPVPDGGVVVSTDPTGIRAMSALRFDGTDAGGAKLTLKIASGSTPGPLPQACPALSDWQAGGDQPWAARPAHDCARVSVTGALSVDGTTISWDLPDTFKPAGATNYDVLLVPSGGDGTPFQTIFEKPGDDAFTVTSPPAEETPFIDEPLPPDIPPAIDELTNNGYDTSNVPAGADGLTVPTVPTPTVVRTTPAPAPVASIFKPLENPNTRRIAVLILFGLGAYLYWQSNQGAKSPRLLGALSGPGSVVVSAIATPIITRSRGIGRFQRPRSQPPHKL